MPIAKKSLIARFFLAAMLVVAASASTKAQPSPLPSQDVVVLVDCSESATPYLRAINGILSRFAGGARRGDSLTCYQFSNTPVLIARMRLAKTGDVSRLRAQLDLLQAGGELTSFAPALRRAMADIVASHSARPTNERVLLLITDGRRHPKDTKSEKKAFDQLLKEYSRLKAGRDYSFYSFYIGDWYESDLQEYLLSAGAHLANWSKDAQWLERLTIADIRIMDRTASLEDMPDVPSQGVFSIAFYPRRPPSGLAMLELDTRATFLEATLDRFFTANPRRFICQQEPWSEKFFMETRGFARGAYHGTFHFTPSEPRALLLHPRDVDFSLTILGVLEVNISGPLEFGPTGLRGEYRETRQIIITPSNDDFPSGANAIWVTSEIDLPEGVRLEVSKVREEKEVIVNIAIARDETLSGQAGGKYEGRIVLSPQSGWMLTESEIPISVEVARRGVDSGAVLFYAAIAIAGVAGVVMLLFVFKNLRTAVLDYFTQKIRPVGKLVITSDPTRGLVKNINLDRLSEKMREKDIVVGMGGGVHVDMPHLSMSDKMYVFSGGVEGEEEYTIVESGKTTDHVIINEMSRTGRIRLKHLDKIKMGAFEFRYEAPEPLRKVVLYYLSGEVIEGWLLSWNIDAEGFHFLSREKLSGKSEQTRGSVRFYELKAMAFVRDFDGELTQRLLSLKTPRSGHRVRLTLADQEELVGYILNWQDPGEKFYLFPDSMGDNVMFFVIEKNTLKDMSLIREDEKGAKRARAELARVLGKMKKEIAG